MTLEEINRRLKKNPYYEGSQAQKEANAGVKFQNNNVIMPENSRAQIEQIRQEYGNGNTDNNFSKRDYSYITINKNNKNNKIDYSKFPSMSNIIETPRMKEKLSKKSTIKNNKEIIKEYQTELDNLYRSKEYTELQNWLNTDTNFKKNLLSDKYNERLQQFETLQNEAKELNKKIDDIKKENIDLSDVTDTDRLLAPLNSAYTGVQSTVRGLGNAINRLSGNEELLYKGITPEEYKSQKVREKQNGVEQVISDISNSLGQMAVLAPISAIPYVGKAASLATLGLSAGGESYKQSIEEGKSDEEALKYASLVGAGETLLQKALGGVKVFGNSVIGNKVNNVINKVVKSDVGKKSLQYMSNMLGEGFEEYLQEILNPVYRNISFNENNKVNPLDEDALYSGLIGTLSAGAMNVPSYLNQRNQSINLDKKSTNSMARLQLPRYTNSTSDNIIQQNQNNASQKQIAPLSEQAQIKYDSDNFAKQIDAVKNGTFPKRDMLTLGRTPKILQELGLKNLPITMTQKHLDTIMNKSGKYKANYHNLGEDIVKKLPKALNNPLDILKSSTKDNSIVLTTDLSDKQDRTIIASIKIDGKGDINSIRIDTNVMTSAYGRNNYDKFMQENIKAGNLLYDIDQGIIKKIDKKTVGERLQLPMRDSSDVSGRLQLSTNNISINNIIPQNENYASSNKKVSKNIVERSDLKTNKTPTVDFIVDKRTKEKTSLREVKDFLTQKIVNKGHTVDKLAKSIKNPNLTYTYDRTLSSFSEANYSIGKGQTNNKGEVIGKSLNEIFEHIEDLGLSKEFDDYLLNRHNLDRMAVEKAVYDESITSEISRKIIKDYEEKYPQFKEVAKEVYKFNKNELNNIVEAGFIDKNTMDYLNELYGDYVPIHRDIIETVQKIEDSKNISNNPIKRAVGGYNPILSIKEAMAEQVVMNKKAIRMNELGLEIAKSLGEKAVIDPGIEITYSPSAIMSLGGDVVTFNGEQPIFTIFKNGIAKDIKIGDDLYDSLKKDNLINKIQNNKKLNKLLTPIEKMSSTQRDLLTTYSIGFALSNPLKDFQDGMFNTKYSSTRYIKNYNKALIEICLNGKNYNTYLANGGNSNTYFDYQKGLVPQTTKNPIKIFTNMIRNINEVLEQAPRLAEYISTIEKGGTINEAMYNAADITTNFKRGGEYAKVLNKYGANFLNASIQGLDKQYRNLTGQRGWKGYANLLVKTTTLGIGTAILNHLLLKDDEDYEDLPSYVKDNYYLFKIDNGKFFRIPKGRVLNIIGSTTRRILEGIEGKDVDLKGLANTVVNQLAPNNPLESNIFSPIKAVKNNKTWYGEDIVSSRLQKELPKNQYDETTDSISRWLGSITNISPKKINYLIDQYSGGIGDIVLPKLTPQSENNIIEDKFTTDAVMKNKNVSEFYNSLEEFQQKSNDSEATDTDKVKYKYLSSISSDMSEFYKQKREVQNSNMSDKDKKEIVRDIQKQINNLAEKGVSALKSDMTVDNKWDMYINAIFSDKIRENDNSSDVIDAQYAIKNKICTKEDYMKLYEKCRENKIEMPTMKILEKMNNTGIDLNNYIDYKIGTKGVKGDTDNEGKVIKSSTSTKEAKYILSMNISDKQKDILLKFLSDTETPPTVSDLKKLNGEYLTYMQQSGKKEDGVSQRDKYMMYVDAGIPVKTLNKYYEEIGKIEGTKDSNGKTISGSKKSAIFNYINNLNINATQKKILFTKCNSSYGKNYKNEIFEYINSLKINKQRKEAIWKELYG